MTAPTIYSERLGTISDDQFKAAAARLGLGRFVSAAPISSGLFGQNVFLTTSKGQFVLRGAPHWVKGPKDKAYRREDRWQFAKEAYFVQQLHEQTATPAPWPYLRDESTDIFGWQYAVMPRMPGACFEDRTIREKLTLEDQRGVAAALGAMLAEMQKLKSPFAGDFDVDSIALVADDAGNTQRVIAETRSFIAAAQANHALTAADCSWIDDMEKCALGVADRPMTYVHCDYKLNNLTVMRQGGEWRVSGLFDFHEARFGDGALDIVRQACSYLDMAPNLARAFVEAYRAAAGIAPEVRSLMPLYIVNDRLKVWAYFTQPEKRAPWTGDTTFRDWGEPYHKGIMALL